MFQILDTIALQDVHTVDEISAASGIPRSSVHRILQNLVREDVVSLISKRGYGFTPRLITLGLKGMGERTIIEVAIPVMKMLCSETRETVSLHVQSGYERVCLCRFEGDYPLNRRIRVGDKDVLFRGAAGKIIAAGLRDEELEREASRYVKLGVIKPEDRESVLAEIRKVREQGYAISIAERIVNSGSIGVPLRDYAGNIRASLSISSVIERLNKENMDNYLKLLLKAADEIFKESARSN